MKPGRQDLPRGFGSAFGAELQKGIDSRKLMTPGRPVEVAPPTIPGIDITPMQLVERAVKNAIPHDANSAARWIAVMNAFGCGSTYANRICRYFGVDPGEEVRGRVCEVCERNADEEN